ncbi:phage tail tape measure protein [Oceanithermus sp.]|uniref:phage tail tape measure protein n=1 Tax=Oceanithermus sp. TaxID=2268145 RepID=UPI0025F2BC25|nr:phage tail tape measure protein [Oceanithermus sp.]
MARLTLGDLVYKLGFENEDEFLRELDALFKKAEAEGAASGKKAGGSFLSGFGGVFGGVALGTMAAQMFQRVVDASKEFARESVREFATFEQGLVQLKLAGVQNLGEVSDELQRIAEAARVFSGAEVSLAVGTLVKAGYAASDALELVRRSADLAAAEIDPLTGEFADLGGVAEQVGQVLRAMGLDVSESARVVDVLAKAAQDSSLDVTELVQAVARVAPVAAQAGYSIEDVSAAIAVMSNAGIESEMAARGLRSVLSALVDPPKAVAGQFEALGLTLVDTQGRTRSMSEILEALGKVARQGGTGMQILAQGMDTFAATIAARMGQSAKEIDDFARALDGADGAAQQLGDTIRDSTLGQTKELQARLRDAQRVLGEEFAPTYLWAIEHVLIPFAQALGGIVRALNDLQDAFVETMARDLFGAPVVVSFEKELKNLEQEIDRKTAKLADLEGRINESRAQGLRIPQRALDSLNRQRAELEELIKKREVLIRIIERQAEAERRAAQAEADARNKPQPPPAPTTGTGSSGADTGTDSGDLDRLREARARVSVLRAEYELGRISAGEYVRGLTGIARELDALAKAAGTEEDRASALGALVSVNRELQRLGQRAQQEFDAAVSAWRKSEQELFKADRPQGPGIFERLIGVAGEGAEGAAGIAGKALTSIFEAGAELVQRYAEDYGELFANNYLDAIMRENRKRMDREEFGRSLYPIGEFEGADAGTQAERERNLTAMYQQYVESRMRALKIQQARERRLREEEAAEQERLMRRLLPMYQQYARTRIEGAEEAAEKEREFADAQKRVAEIMKQIEGADPYQDLLDELEALKRAFPQLGNAVDDLKAKIEHLGKVEAFNKLAAEIADAANVIMGALRELGDVMSGETERPIEGVYNALGDLVSLIPEVGPALGALVKTFGSLMQEFAKLDPMAEQISKMRAEAERQAMDTGLRLIGNEAVTKLEAYTKRVFFGLFEVTRYRAAVDEWAMAIGQALEGGIVGAIKGATKAFIEGADNWAEVLNRGIREAIVNAVLEAIVQQAVIEGILGPELTKLTEQLRAGEFGDARMTIDEIVSMIPDIEKAVQDLAEPFRGVLDTGSPGAGPVDGGVNAITYGLPQGPVISTPVWVNEMGDYVQQFGEAVDRFATAVDSSSGSSWFVFGLRSVA